MRARGATLELEKVMMLQDSRNEPDAAPSAQPAQPPQQDGASDQRPASVPTERRRFARRIDCGQREEAPRHGDPRGGRTPASAPPADDAAPQK